MFRSNKKKTKHSSMKPLKSHYETLKSTENWGLIGVSLYLLCLGLPFGVTLSNLLICTVAIVTVILPSKYHLQEGKVIVFTILVFIMTTAFSTFMSVDYTRSLTLNLSLFPAIVVFYVLVHYFSVSHSVYLLAALTFLAIEIDIYLLSTWLISVSDHPVNWVYETSLVYLSTPNDLLLVALISPFSLALSRLSTNPVVQGVALVSLLLGFIVMLIFRSNAALLAMLVGLLTMGVMLWHTNAIKVLVPLLVVMVIGDGLLGFWVFGKMADLEVWGNRLPLWLAAKDMFLDAPLLGMGPGSFSLLSEAYMEGQRLPEWVTPDPRHAPWAHNMYLELLAERGIFGLLSWFTVMVFVVKELLLIRATPKRTATKSGELISTALIASISTLIVGGIFELSLLRHWVLILTAVICALTIALSNQLESFEQVD